MKLRIALLAAAMPLGAATAQEIGIPACDAYYRQLDACISNRIPEAQRAMWRQQMEAARGGMRQMAGNAAARPQAEASCNAQRQQMMQALASYNCSWN